MKALKKFLLQAFIAFGAVLVLLFLTLVLPFPRLAKIFLFPGSLMFFVTAVIPDRVVYYLFPAGGLDATVGLITLISFVFWWLTFIVAQIMLRRLITKTAKGPKDPPFS